MKWGILISLLVSTAGAAQDLCQWQMLFPSAQRATATSVGIPGRTGFIYDTTAGYDAIGGGARYDRQTYGNPEAQTLVRHFLRQKNFNDGVLDIVVVVLDPLDRFEPAPQMGHAWGIVNFFGTIPGLAGRNGPRGMRRNPDALRHVRLLVVESHAPRSSRNRSVPVAVLQLASDIARDFRTEVAVPLEFLEIVDNDVRAPSDWLRFTPPPESTP